jgi:uncharacterized protein (DUF1501 family)
VPARWRLVEPQPAATANASGNRFALVILRGGMDGCRQVPAPGDPAFEAARGPLGRYAATDARLD